MDDIRSCYRTTMRFFNDSDLEIPVRWFFAAPGAKEFPAWQRFASGNWSDRNEDWDGVGEVNKWPRHWRDGAAPPYPGPPGPGFEGQSFAGPLEYFQEGAPSSAMTIGCNPDGSCDVCQGLLPPCPCAVLNDYSNSDLLLTIIQVDNPLSPPVGTVGQQFRFVNFAPNTWISVIVGPYPPSVEAGYLILNCDTTPTVPLFSLYFYFPYSPVVYQWVPWRTVLPIVPGVLNLRITWGLIAYTLAGETGNEVWTMALTLA